MGPSGAGKTTVMKYLFMVIGLILFSVLLGRVKKSSGKLLINGAMDNIKKYRKSTAFVPQVRKEM
jgi:ABC-type multidrug transport system ATPase subunit